MTLLKSLTDIATGGRTAWSATVTVSSLLPGGRDWNIAARYWYDGQYVNNAREDAAEVMISQIRNPALLNQAQQSTQRTQSSYGSAGWAR